MGAMLAVMSALSVRADPICYVCDEVVELNTALASCFQQSYDKILATARSSPASRAEVNFSACGASDEEKRGIDSMPLLGSGEQKKDGAKQVALRSVYILDTASIVCLRRLLDAQGNNLDPRRSFDLQEECQP
ncbi:hypothetical protein [Rhizobium sp. WYJ-E13]|uniref:hypothetical protein n=1 Tax=Rhizobium sp. WYJ-E13 TaxID=2849093 RepID=UPI0020A75FD8|nr:hypothetical protein [Rhizobium sp. WYJ-E13]